MKETAPERDAVSIEQEWNPRTSVTLEAEKAPRHTLSEFLNLYPDSPEARAIASMRRPIPVKKQKIGSRESHRTSGAVQYIEGLTRRLNTSLRLPPLECGCRDTDTALHRNKCLGGL